MSEVFPSPENGGVSSVLLEESISLGYPLRRLNMPAFEAGSYSERAQLLEESSAVVKNMHDGMTAVAEQLGIAVTPLENWEPSKAELDKLRQEQVVQRKRFQMLDGLADFTSSPRMHRLLPQQRDAMRATQGFMEVLTRMRAPDGSYLPGKSGYIDVPTGMGKTGMLVSVAQALKSKEDPKDPIRVLVLSPTLQLQRQTIGDPEAKAADRKGFAKFAKGLKPTAYNGNEHNISDLTVMTNASFNALVQKGEMPDFDVILIDETHTGLGENISDSIRQYYQDKITIGFTATPDYHDEKMTSHLLEHEIFKITLPNGIKAGRLAPVRAEHRDLQLTIEESSLPDDPRERRRAIEYAYLKARLADALPDIKRTIKAGHGVLVRCPPGGDVAFAKEAARLLQEEFVSTEDGYLGKVKAAAVGGSTQRADELDILLNAFNKGENKVHVICYVNAINMGTDLPPGKCFVDLYPMRQRVPIVQGMGRVLRLIFDDAGKPIPATVITYKDDRLGDEQYSCLDALELRPGESSLRQQWNYQERYGDVVFELHEVHATSQGPAEVVGEIVIRHEVVLADEQLLVTFDEACEMFEVSPVALSHYLEEFGYKPQESLRLEDYEAVVELMGDAASPSSAASQEPLQPFVDDTPESSPVTHEGYMELSELIARTRWGLTQGELRRQLRGLGIPIRQVRHDGRMSYYVDHQYIADKHLRD